MRRSYPIWLIVLARAVTVLYALAVVTLSLLPSHDVPMPEVSDKYKHAAAYGVFAVLLNVSFFRPRRWSMVLTFLIVSSMGLSIEFVQPYFHRSREALDALANALGAAAGCVFLLSVRSLQRPKPVPATISA